MRETEFGLVGVLRKYKRFLDFSSAGRAFVEWASEDCLGPDKMW